MDKADAATDRIESQITQRLSDIYSEALKKALSNYRSFLQKVADVDSGKIKPPAVYGDDKAKIAKWREGFLRELIRRENVAKGIADELAKAGAEVGKEIREKMVDVYQINSDHVHGLVEDAGYDISFATPDRRQLEVITQKNESPFSKIAYRNLGANVPIRQRLQRELGIATANGESQREIISRIRKVTGMSVSQARRVAQTERTRVQSQARWQAGEEAKALGVEIVNEWSTRMVNSRDTHVALNGKKAPQGERFPGSVLRFPGDPEGPAHEVINCHCVLVPDVVMPHGRKNYLKATETLENTGKSGIIISGKQLGHKAGKHMKEWELNASNAEDRAKFIEITKNIQENAQEVRRVEWLHDPTTGKRTVEVDCYILGDDVVLVNDNGEYITTMRGGINNGRVKNGRRKK